MSEPLLKVENVAASCGSIVALKSVSLEVIRRRDRHDRRRKWRRKNDAAQLHLRIDAL